MKVILDVGSRNGESVEEFVRWPFDVIHAFEPMPAQFANLEALAATDSRIQAHNYGLSDQTATLSMYGADLYGEASVFSTKADLDPRTVTECQFVATADFFTEHVAADDTVFMKLNCEGSEIAILNQLLDTGDLFRVAAVRVEFDISRVVGHEDEADKLLARLDEAGYDRLTIGSNARLTPQGLIDDVPQVGTHHERLHGWLETVDV